MNNIKIKPYPAKNPPLLFIKGFKEILNKGYLQLSDWPVNQVFNHYLALEGLTHVGILSFSYQSDKKISIDLAYVLPEYRGQGIFTQLLNELRRKEDSLIETTVHVNNKGMLRNVLNKGFKKTYITLELGRS